LQTAGGVFSRLDPLQDDINEEFVPLANLVNQKAEQIQVPVGMGGYLVGISNSSPVRMVIDDGIGKTQLLRVR